MKVHNSALITFLFSELSQHTAGRNLRSPSKINSISQNDLLERKLVDLIPIVGYFPGSSVVDHGNVDLDQAAMESAIFSETDDKYAKGKAIYTEGGNSKAIATLTFDEQATVIKKTPLTGITNSGGIASVTVYSENIDSTSLSVKYVDFLACQVGGLESDDQNTDGCLVPTGTITDGTSTYAYSGVVNSNERSLQYFSTTAEAKMIEEKHALWNVDYYGHWDYADRWVLNALNGNGDLELDNFQADFSLYGDDGRQEGIRKGTVLLNTFLYTIHEFEAGVVRCKEGVSFDQTDAIHKWDEGVAFYAGGLEGVDGSGSGRLIYAIADKRCSNFGTCGEEGNTVEGTSFVNIELVKLFNQGFQDINAGDCKAAKKTKDLIADLMYVPLVQGTLRYAWYKANEGTEREQAVAATHAASILARVHVVDPAAAQTIASNLAISSSTANIQEVKEALESVYSSMNINCALVGGLINPETQEYYDGMEPCVSAEGPLGPVVFAAESTSTGTSSSTSTGTSSSTSTGTSSSTSTSTIPPVPSSEDSDGSDEEGVPSADDSVILIPSAEELEVPSSDDSHVPDEAHSSHDVVITSTSTTSPAPSSDDSHGAEESSHVNPAISSSSDDPVSASSDN